MSLAPPVSGTFSATGQSASFAPIWTNPARGFNVAIWGTFSATVVLERSLDGGTTWIAVTAGGSTIYSLTGPASEICEDPGRDVLYRLNCTVYASGTVNYLLRQ